MHISKSKVALETITTHPYAELLGHPPRSQWASTWLPEATYLFQDTKINTLTSPNYF